ncbi:MAG: hypothetical protein ACO31I_16045 [Prochlorotrichaceae cyanobacterium]|jgi:hypothetical protein
MSENNDLKTMILQLRDRQNAFEEQMLRLFQEMNTLRLDFQVQAADEQRRWAEEQRRWADTQTDIRELMFENQRILRWLEQNQPARERNDD